MKHAPRSQGSAPSSKEQARRRAYQLGGGFLRSTSAYLAITIPALYTPFMPNETPAPKPPRVLKGRSGNFRKSYAQQDVIEVLASSLRLIRRFIRDETIPIERRIDVAARFALKTIPESIQVAQTVSLRETDRAALLVAFRSALSKSQVIESLPNPPVNS